MREGLCIKVSADTQDTFAQRRIIDGTGQHHCTNHPRQKDHGRITLVFICIFRQQRDKKLKEFLIPFGKRRAYLFWTTSDVCCKGWQYTARSWIIAMGDSQVRVHER